MRQSSDIVAVEGPEVAAAIRFIRSHAKEPISVDDVLRKVPISRRAMGQRFIRIVGRSPKMEIIRLRTEQAKILLAETSLPIFQISSRLGFPSQEVFSVFFHRQLGQAPSEFRRGLQLESAPVGR